MHNRRAFVRLTTGCLWAFSAVATGCYRSAPSELPAGATADWNTSQVAWVGYKDGLSQGKAAHTPILLVIYTDWCPHCHNYSRLFHDPEVVELSRRFVMIRVERDANRDISEVYDIDGEYIPRTFFLAPSGAVLTDLVSDNEDFRYFLDEHDPSELCSLMERALERSGSPQSGLPDGGRGTGAGEGEPAAIDFRPATYHGSAHEFAPARVEHGLGRHGERAEVAGRAIPAR